MLDKRTTVFKIYFFANAAQSTNKIKTDKIFMSYFVTHNNVLYRLIKYFVTFIKAVIIYLCYIVTEFGMFLSAW